ncbi:hypothetical protein E2C01_005162 [Portunus trituberculatus]|uniref:Uncharacterized protein n=1 Tax=Portunus trituberculatus TaxID=210409 RepID=A0A5B7CUT3_PORTR|nr:hypothetical protein [Portunus trituberculatus]
MLTENGHICWPAECRGVPMPGHHYRVPARAAPPAALRDTSGAHSASAGGEWEGRRMPWKRACTNQSPRAQPQFPTTPQPP